VEGVSVTEKSWTFSVAFTLADKVGLTVPMTVKGSPCAASAVFATTVRVEFCAVGDEQEKVMLAGLKVAEVATPGFPREARRPLVLRVTVFAVPQKPFSGVTVAV
jgi:hypothetical protein